MKLIWMNYYESLIRMETPWYKLAVSSFNKKDDMVLSSTGDRENFRTAISETEGTNCLILPAPGKTVRIMHAVHTITAPDKKSYITFGINGLSDFPTFNCINEPKAVKRLIQPKATIRSPAIIYPQPVDFAEVTSTEEFKSAKGVLTDDLEENPPINLQDLPNFFFLHPIILLSCVESNSMSAAQLAVSIIKHCKNGYNNDDVPDEDTGVTRALDHCHKLLLFLWSIEQGFSNVVPVLDIPASDEANRICQHVYLAFENWTKSKHATKPTTDDPFSNRGQKAPDDLTTGVEEEESDDDDMEISESDSSPSPAKARSTRAAVRKTKHHDSDDSSASNHHQKKKRKSRKSRSPSVAVDDDPKLDERKPAARRSSNDDGRKAPSRKTNDPPPRPFSFRNIPWDSPSPRDQAGRVGFISNELEPHQNRPSRLLGHNDRRSSPERDHRSKKRRQTRKTRPTTAHLDDRGRSSSRSESSERERTVTTNYRRDRSASPQRRRDRDDRGRDERRRNRRSPSPRDRRRPPSPRRNRDRRRARGGGRGGGGDRGSSSDSDSDRSRRNPRRGDDRNDRPRRRSPSTSSDDDYDDRRDRRGREHRRRGQRNEGRRDRRRGSRERSRDRSPRRNQYGRRAAGRRGRDENNAEALMAQCLVQLTNNSTDMRMKKESEKSMTSRLPPQQADLHRIFGAKDWYDEEPRMNSFLSKLMADKDMRKAQGMVASQTRKWPWKVSDKGLADFLATGYAIYDVSQSGFTGFMFKPKIGRTFRTTTERKMAVKAMFGKIELEDSALNYYTTSDDHISSTYHELEQQFTACIAFLELVTREGGPAAEGYRFALRYLEENRQYFVEAIEADSLFCARYMNLADRVFQGFVDRMCEFHMRSNPIKLARESGLQGSQEQAIRQAMTGFESGVVPNLSLPIPLVHNTAGDGHEGGGGHGGNPRGVDKDKGAGGGGMTPKGHKEKEKEKSPDWWSKNPDPQAAWCLPTGKQYKDYFDSTVKKNAANLKGWPKLPYHRNPSLMKYMCLKYQTTGKCKANCYLAHVPPKKIPKEPYDAVTDRLKEPLKATISPKKKRERPREHATETRFPSLKRYRSLDALARRESPSPDRAPARVTFHKSVPRDTRPKESRDARPKESKDPSPYGLSWSRKYTSSPEPHNTSDEDSDSGDSDGELPPLSAQRDHMAEKLTADLPETDNTASEKQKAATSRNRERVRQANQRDTETIGKYLPAKLELIFDQVVRGADDYFKPPPWLLDSIKTVAAAPVPTPDAPDVRFEVTPEALDHNDKLLASYDHDFERFLASQSTSTLHYGSEFRPVDQLEMVLGGHPNFAFFKDILHNGMQYHFTESLSEEERKKELEEQIQRGNHKSAQEEIEVATKLLHKDVAHGFAMPIPSSTVPKIKGAMVQPGGVANQFKLQADRSRKLAARLTHDLTYGISKPKVSVNDRIDMSMYAEMVYGWCLSRIIHFIVALRLQHPQQKIFLAKYDYSDAYRRVVHAASAAVQTILIVADVAYIMLRLAFGGAPNPPTWCAFSEMVTDLSNEIDLIDDWDPADLHSPAQPDTPIPRSLPDDIPFAEARPLAVDVPVLSTSRTDSFIDDLIRIFLDTPRNRQRSPHAVPLAIHVTSRPHSGDKEPIQRRDLLSAPKLEAEGLPVEIQVVLGWDLDTRRLLVLLPNDKYVAWSGHLSEVIDSGRVSFGDLESLIGRLNHVAYLIPLARHFLPRLRRRIENRRSKKQVITLSKEEIEDLLLWTDFLFMASQGISMNRLTVRPPSQLGFSDSCPLGLGGYLFTGKAWRLLIPPTSPLYGVSEANNIFEFLALAINLWVIILECAENQLKQECILILGDSTSALGWLYKIRFFASDSFYHEATHMIARKIARLIAGSSHCLASQHLKGELNIVADLLSYSGVRGDKRHPLAYDSPDDRTLTQRFHDHLPQFIPSSFEICPLPAEILSFATVVLQTTESSYMRSKNLRTKTEIACGDVGSPTVVQWDSAFLVYIRPQMLEAYNSMSEDMIKVHSFFDTYDFDQVGKTDPRLRQRLLRSFDGRDSAIVMPKFYLHH